MALEGSVPYRKSDAAKYNKYRWWLGITFGDMLDKAADIYPNKEALVDGPRRFTYAQVREQANRLAIGLMGLGIRKRERVLLQFPNWSEFIYTYFALQKIGAIPILCIARYTQTEINHFCRLTGAVAWIGPERYGKIEYTPVIEDASKNNPDLKHVIFARSKGYKGSPSLEELIDKARLTKSNLERLAASRPDPMEVAHLGPTGGSTGLPKVAPRTHNSYITRSEYTARAWELGNDDICLVVAPVAHDLTFSVAICPTIFTYGKLVMLDSTEPADMLPVIEREKVTAVAWVPTLAERLVNSGDLGNYNIRSLRKMYCGGQASPPTLVKAIRDKLGCVYFNGYGGTEGHNTMTRLDYDQSTVHLTVGKSVCPYDTYKIVDMDGKELPLGAQGELIVKGPCVFTGYYNAPEENKNAFTADGFFKTGDQAKIDKQGNITLTGRIKDIIKRGGENISPVEIEHLILTHSQVEQVAVIGMPDPVLSERICAYVKCKPGSQLCFENVIAHLKGKGASLLQLPERIEFVDNLPVTEAGKTDKNHLRADIRCKLTKEGFIKE